MNDVSDISDCFGPVFSVAACSPPPHTHTHSGSEHAEWWWVVAETRLTWAGNLFNDGARSYVYSALLF